MDKMQTVEVPSVTFNIVASRSFTSSKTGKTCHVVDVSVPGVGNGTLFLPDGVEKLNGIKIDIFKGQVGFRAF